MTTLETVSKNKQSRLQDFYAFRRDGLNELSKEKMKRIVIMPDKDRVKTAEMIEILRRSNIEVKVANNSSFIKHGAHLFSKKCARRKQNFSRRFLHH